MKSTRLEMSSRSGGDKRRFNTAHIHVNKPEQKRSTCSESVPSLKVQNFLVIGAKTSSPEMAGSSRTFFST